MCGGQKKTGEKTVMENESDLVLSINVHAYKIISGPVAHTT